jgi:hypothetical protein
MAMRPFARSILRAHRSAEPVERSGAERQVGVGSSHITARSLGPCSRASPVAYVDRRYGQNSDRLGPVHLAPARPH